MKKINVIGGGLAGSEAVYFLVKRGYDVTLYDIKPNNFTPAHSTPDFGELVCSNSLKSNDVYGNACGLLKEELRILGSFVIDCADKTKVPAGSALAVDREKFSRLITDGLKQFDNVHFVCQDVCSIDFETPTIIATGPLTTDGLSRFIKENFSDGLYFYDAASPIVLADSIDMDNAFIADRYGEAGVGDYINCPIDKEGYLAFYDELINAKTAEKHSFEQDVKVFEGCMPVEIMAKRGVDTLRFGPLKPVGLTDPKTGRWPYASLQLRKENSEGTMYNLVGFQTNLLFGEQKRVFSMFPALKNAEFIRYGVMHRNTYLNSPLYLDDNFSVKDKPLTYFAGQITGVEGYVESVMSGLVSAISLDRKLQGKEKITFSDVTVTGALSQYVSLPNSNFQPMNANYGILRAFPRQKDKAQKKRMQSQRALDEIKKIRGIIYE